jgi:long-chain acyl-CoA synthetase
MYSIVAITKARTPMERIWLNRYPTSTNADISFDHLTSITDCLDIAFRKYPKNPAATCMGTTIHYHELEQSINRFANYLHFNLKLQKGDRIAIMMPNCIQFLISELAALKLGIICVNTNPLYTPREMKHQFSDSGAKAIIILDLFVSKLEAIVAETSLQHVIVTSIGDQLPFWKRIPLNGFMHLKKMVPKYALHTISFKKALKGGGVTLAYHEPLNLDDIAILQYTGGTTGVAKGAMLTHRNILANMLQIQGVMAESIVPGTETVLTALPLYHIFALSVNFLSFLATGHHMILVPKPVPITNTVKIFKDYKITVMTGVNTLFNSLNHSKEFKELAPKSLKVVVAGGMALQDSVNKTFQKITGVPITEGFGLTEASPVTHVNPLKGANPIGSIGIPLQSTYAKIISDDGKDLKPGESGELIIKGPQVMKGYWKRDDETNKTIKDGWLYTGDIARMDENGFFYIVDRKKDMILVSGFNVYPNEIEEVIASHPKVLEVAVVAIPDKNSGEAVKAFVVPKDKSLTLDELKAFCKENLTGYKCPRHYEFKESLPKSNIGKILRRELRDGAPS